MHAATVNMHCQILTMHAYMYTTAFCHDIMFPYAQLHHWYSPVHDYRTGTHLCTTTPLVLTCAQLHHWYSPVHNYTTGTHLCTTTGLVLTCAQLYDWYSPVHNYTTGTHLCTREVEFLQCSFYNFSTPSI